MNSARLQLIRKRARAMKLAPVHNLARYRSMEAHPGDPDSILDRADWTFDDVRALVNA